MAANAVSGAAWRKPPPEGWIDASFFSAAGIAAFFVGHILSDFTWYGFVSVSVAYGRRFLGHAFYRWLIFGCGVFLVGLAFSFIIWGARTL